jgi:3-oxoacyl-(acyl-carrier-protein) synthase
VAVIHKALKQAGVSAKEIDIIRMHSSPMGDAEDCVPFVRVLDPPINTTKSLIGHGLTAAGGRDGCDSADERGPTSSGAESGKSH